MSTYMDVFLADVSFQKETRNILPQQPKLLALSQKQGEVDGRLNKRTSSSSASSSSSSSSSSSLSSYPSSPSESLMETTQEICGLKLKYFEYGEEFLYIVISVPGQFQNTVRAYDVLVKINEDCLRRLDPDRAQSVINKSKQRMSYTLTLYRWKSEDLMTKMEVQITTQVKKRDVRHLRWITKKAKIKVIQIDSLANMFAFATKDAITAKPFEKGKTVVRPCSKAPPFYFFIRTFTCSETSEGKEQYYVGFTFYCKVDGKKYDVCSDIANSNRSSKFLKLKPHAPVELTTLDERFFIQHELSSKQSVIESLLYKDFCVTYDIGMNNLVMKVVQDISTSQSASRYRMFTQTSCDFDEKNTENINTSNAETMLENEELQYRKGRQLQNDISVTETKFWSRMFCCMRGSLDSDKHTNNTIDEIDANHRLFSFISPRSVSKP